MRNELRRGVLLALLLAAPLPAIQDKGRLDEAREKFDQREEGAHNEGVKLCVEQNDVAAVELMLTVLREMEDRSNWLPQAHYRDISWGGLAKITDPYARRRVGLEVQQSKIEWVRQWCLELLGEYGEFELGEFAQDALKSKDLGVQRAAARSLGKMKFTPAAKALQPKASDADEILRANAIESLCRIDAAANLGLFLKGLKDKDGGVRCALLGAAPGCYAEKTEEWSTAALEDADWRPRMQAVDNLGAIRTKGAVDGLILALGDGRPAVVARAVTKLQTLTGQKHRAKEAWTAWWAASRGTFEFPDGSAKPHVDPGLVTVAYHGVEVRSDHAAFMIDVSDEMGQQLKSKGATKEVAALAELDEVLGKLEGKLAFDLFVYAEQVVSMFDNGPIDLTARHRKRALDFVKDAEKGNAKDIWQVLETVVSNPDLDTAFLLSSGEPDIGTYVHWNRVTWHLADLNRFHKVVVHTIAYSDSEWYRSQLEKIAEVTGGEFRWFE